MGENNRNEQKRKREKFLKRARIFAVQHRIPLIKWLKLLKHFNVSEYIQVMKENCRKMYIFIGVYCGNWCMLLNFRTLTM